MTGNEVTPNYYGEAVFLRVSGFVQRVRLDRESEASHDLNRLLDKPGFQNVWDVMQIAFYRRGCFW